MLLANGIQDFIRHIESEKGLSSTTVSNYEYELKRLLLFFQEQGLHLAPGDISSRHIDRYIECLREERRYKPASVKRVISIIRSFFNFLMGEGAGGVEENPTRNMPAVKMPKKLPQILTPAEIHQFLSGIKKVSSYPARDYAISLFFLQTCCRLQELQRLRVGSVDLRKQHVDIAGLGGLKRRIPLTKEACRALEDYLEVRNPRTDTDLLFLSPLGVPMSKSNISCLFRSLAKKTGIYRQGLSVHKLRHTCLTSKLQEGVNIGELQEIAGHASQSSTNIYKKVAHSEKVRQTGISSVGEN